MAQDDPGHVLVALYGNVIAECASLAQVDDLVSRRHWAHRPPPPTSREDLLNEVLKTPFTHAVVFDGAVVRRLFGIADDGDPEAWGKLGYRLPSAFVPLLDPHLDLLWIINCRQVEKH